AAYYYLEIAADRYVSEFRYSVRSGLLANAGDEDSGSALDPGSILSAGDSYILEDYLSSGQAMVDLEARLPLREMLAKDGGDPVRRYAADLPPEELVDFWREAVRVRFDLTTGITSVKVTLFTPEDARAVADELVSLLRELVDELAESAQAQMLAYVNGEVATSRTQVNSARDLIEEFRRTNRTFDPSVTTGQTEQLIAELNAQISELRTQLASLPVGSPRAPNLESRISSLESQIAEQRAKLDTGGDAEALNRFERLQREYEIEVESYIATLELRQNSRATATLSQVHLVVFVPPKLPALSTAPDRPLEILIVGLIALGIWLVVRIFMASLRTP
ncbi:MAG: hypothetical protein AAF568_08360, partial [Pseudomonadota bacterium]